MDNNRITCLVKVPDNKNFKTSALQLVEEALNKFCDYSEIDWEVLDNGDREAFEIYCYPLCQEEITGIRHFMLVWDKDPFTFIKPEGHNWYITFKNNYIAGDDPMVCIQAMLNFVISSLQKREEQIVAIKHLPEKNEPVLE